MRSSTSRATAVDLATVARLGARRTDGALLVQPLLAGDHALALRPQTTRDLAITDIAAERIAAIEREARERGFAFGERQARDAMRPRVDALLTQLSSTIASLAALRTNLIERTERDLVQLAIAVAERIVRREIRTDRDVILTIARAAVARLGDAEVVTIHVNPDDLSAMSPTLDEYRGTGPVRLVADGSVPPGGCFVASDGGTIDAAIDAQFQELRAQLLELDARTPRGEDGTGGSNPDA
jgi:flagellar assembly protein FliH